MTSKTKLGLLLLALIALAAVYIWRIRIKGYGDPGTPEAAGINWPSNRQLRATGR